MRALLLIGLFACDGSGDDELAPDAGTRDTGSSDSGAVDSGAIDSGAPDAGSGDGGEADAGDSGVTPTGICTGKPCLTRVTTPAEWAAIAGPAAHATRCDLLEETFFILPRAGAGITETIFIDVKARSTVYEFVRSDLAAEVPGMDPQTFFERFERDDMRTYWTGRIFRAASGDHAFSVFTSAYFGSPPDQAAIVAIHDALAAAFTLPLGYAPQAGVEVAQARMFQNVPFPLLLPEPCAGEGCAGGGCLVIPDGTDLCGQFAENRMVPGEIAAKVRLDLVAGSHPLPAQVGVTSLTLFSGGELGVDRRPLASLGPGSLETTSFQGTLSYTYTQQLAAGSDTVDLTWMIYRAGETIVLREPALTDEVYLYGTINAAMMLPDSQIAGGSCDAAGLHLYFIEGETSAGDVFRLEYRHQLPFAGSGPLVLTGAEILLGGAMIEVRDYFRLVYAGVHHNWDNQFVVIFDQPISYMGHDVYGIWIDEPGIECCPVDGIFTIDAAYQKLDTLAVTRYIRAPKLF